MYNYVSWLFDFSLGNPEEPLGMLPCMPLESQAFCGSLLRLTWKNAAPLSMPLPAKFASRGMKLRSNAPHLHVVVPPRRINATPPPPPQPPTKKTLMVRENPSNECAS